MRSFSVEASEDGLRLDQFLSKRCPDFSRNQIQNALAGGLVKVDSRVRAKGYRLTAGQGVHFQPPVPRATAAIPQDLPVAVLYEDEDLVVVNKPADLVVHPAPGHPDGTLVNALLHRYDRLAAAGHPLRPGIVHRLDRGTSGLLVVALNEAALRQLADQIKRRQISRTYLALSWGRWQPPSGTLQGRIGRCPGQRQKMAVVPAGGRLAQAEYRVSEDFDFVQLCQVRLQTGRTHQIRVQFAHAGHPIVGDPIYGDDRRARNVRPVDRSLAAVMVKLARRQMLHAWQLALVHPRGGQALSFQAPLPGDMEAVLSHLRQPPTDKIE
jgi:23S rRNA pseudouridine1911/1915/1917 synthase